MRTASPTNAVLKLVNEATNPIAAGPIRIPAYPSMVMEAKASAALYSIVSTARANGLEPYAYLKHLFTELPKAQTVEDFEALLPFNIIT
jgi:transposase